MAHRDGLLGQGASGLFEIAKADDWGLDATAFDLPPAGELPASADAQAVAEIKLDLAILKYARFARGGRYTVEDQRAVRSDASCAIRTWSSATSRRPMRRMPIFGRSIPSTSSSAPAPGAAKARGPRRGRASSPTASDKDTKRLIINMERWRWMPEELGSCMC